MRSGRTRRLAHLFACAGTLVVAIVALRLLAPYLSLTLGASMMVIAVALAAIGAARGPADARPTGCRR